jgi:HSP20 family protein
MSAESTLERNETQAQPAKAEPTRTGQVYRPNVDIVDTQDELLILADMPGVTADRIDIDFEDGTLTIHGQVAARQEAETDYLLREYGVGDFYRAFQVSEAIDPSRIQAEYSGGVLTLHLPKSEAAKPRKIAVQAK